MHKIRLAVTLGSMLFMPLVTCGGPQGPVNGLAGLPSPSSTPGSNVNPFAPGEFTGER